MWNEIVEKAKLSFIKLYLYLAFDQIEILKNETNLTSQTNDFYLEQATPIAIRNRWEAINEVYIEHKLLGN